MLMMIVDSTKEGVYILLLTGITFLSLFDLTAPCALLILLCPNSLDDLKFNNNVTLSQHACLTVTLYYPVYRYPLPHIIQQHNATTSCEAFELKPA